jgi:hypothetical protein
MNEHRFEDPSLRDIEARLAAAAPRLGAAQQQELLYRCAFKAGQHTGLGRVRRWQVATGAAAALCVAALILPPARSPRPADQRAAVPSSSPQIASESAADESTAARPRQVAPVALDAWQLERRPASALSEELASFEQLDPRMQSSSVAHLLREFAQW